MRHVQACRRPEQDWHLVQGTAVAEVDEVQASEPERGRVGPLSDLGDAAAQHAAPAHILAVLIVHVMRDVERAQRFGAASALVTMPSRPSVQR